jgi:hypothetical protein
VSARRPIAVVLDGPPTPAWQASTLAALEGSPSLEVVELRLAGAVRRGVARRLQARVERHVFSIGADPQAPVRVKPRSAHGTPAALVVWLSERSPAAEETRQLVSLRHGGVAEPLEAAFARAMLADDGHLTSEVLLRSGDGTVVAERTISGVRPFSETMSRTLALRKLSALVPRAVERLPGLDTPAPAPAQVGRPPSAAALLARAATASARALAVRLLFRRPWSIRVRQRGPAPTLGWQDDGGLVAWGAARTYADPFLFEHEGRHHLFCEEVPRDSKQGVISHTELRLDGVAADPPTPVLRAPSHLSYPFVFSHGGEVFMIPESSAAHRVELYRAVRFPREWRRETVLLEEIDAVDCTITAHDGRLWLFAAVAASGASSADELHIFSAERPHGPWRAHPSNPVVSDARCARPAGAIQRWGARIVRPAQDCSRRYGWAISFREIDVLTPTAYAEHEIDRLEPGELGRARATHTYAADGRFEAIDLRRRELRLRPRQVS